MFTLISSLLSLFGFPLIKSESLGAGPEEFPKIELPELPKKLDPACEVVSFACKFIAAPKRDVVLLFADLSKRLPPPMEG